MCWIDIVVCLKVGSESLRIRMICFKYAKYRFNDIACRFTGLQSLWQCAEQCGDIQRCDICNTVNLETTTLQRLTQGGYAACQSKVTHEGEEIKELYNRIAMLHPPTASPHNVG